jgi:hypothetical protein
MQIFVQTDSHVIDISKVALMDVPPRGQVALHLDSGRTLTVTRTEAEALMDAIKKLDSERIVRAIRTGGVA